MANLDSLINQLHMSYNCERKPEYQRKTHTARENTQKDQNHPGGLNCDPGKAAAQWAITFKDQNDSLYRQYTLLSLL